MRNPKKSDARPAAVAVVYSPEQLTQILGSLVADDTATIQQGEAQLKPFLKHPSCIVSLFGPLSSCAVVAVRHQAALLIKKKLVKHYKAFNPTEKSTLKAQLLHIITTEPDKNVANGIAGCIANLAKAVFSITGDTWDELFNTLLALSQNPNPALRVINFSLLEQVCVGTLRSVLLNVFLRLHFCHSLHSTHCDHIASQLTT
jgi:hypothetical protein